MSRVFLIVMDGVGIGGAPDAGRFFNGAVPDTGANTLARIAARRPLRLPVLDGLGLGAALTLASGATAPGLGATPEGLWGAATEASPGKDTPTGHWELAGLPMPFAWTTFPDAEPAFPEGLTREIARLAGTAGILGDCHASGTEIIARLGARHLETGWPIVYTSADSVVQIAAHETRFGLARLLDLCRVLAPQVHAMRVGRVIARPFTGDPASGFTRSANRRDFALEPPGETLLDLAAGAGRHTIALGKIGDIFSGRGIAELIKGTDAELAEALLRLPATAPEGSLTFANFVEFDSRFGHRRDVEGFAAALEWFDTVAGRLIAQLGPGDLALFTADHGNDPGFAGTDHTRERVPVLGWGVGPRAVGQVGFADIGASAAAHLGLAAGRGRSFL